MCLKGFVPKSNEEWSRGYWSNGRFLDNQEFSFDGEDLFPRLAKLGKGKKQEQESLSASQLLLVWSSGLRLYVVCVGGKLTKEWKSTRWTGDSSAKDAHEKALKSSRMTA
ncbi:unnamed protein product [Camellia sinensis]